MYLFNVRYNMICVRYCIICVCYVFDDYEWYMLYV